MNTPQTVLPTEKVKESGLRELLVEQLKDLYSAEIQLAKALPRMEQAAVSAELKEAFRKHLEETKRHAEKLEIILLDLNEKTAGVKCEGMEGLVKEGNKLIKKRERDGEIKDVGLIAAAHREEHYEIAGYGIARTYARILGLNDAADILQKTLDEIGDEDKELTDISDNLLHAAISKEEGVTNEK